jgi:hypothetical protein
MQLPSNITKIHRTRKSYPELYKIPISRTFHPALGSADSLVTESDVMAVTF